MDSLISGRREAVKLAAQCYCAMAGMVIGASLFRETTNHIFAVESPPLWLARTIMFCIVVGIFWFALMLAFGAIGSIPKTVNFGSVSTKRNPVRHFAVTFVLALAVALVLAISAWLALEVNDGYFYSRSLPWIPSLIWLQEAGFRTASGLFPCQDEGFDTSCQAYKILPVFVLSNTVAYLPFSLATVFLARYRESARSLLKTLLSAFLRWGSFVGVVLLCLRLVLHRLPPGVSSPIAPIGVGRTAWLLLEWTVGPISVAFALSIPFVLYRAICAVWRREHVSKRLVDLTRVAMFLLAAQTLGNQYQ